MSSDAWPVNLNRGRVPEAFVAWLWEQHCGKRILWTTAGERLQVIYPGRRGGSWGPDFRGALLCIGATVVRGDVEIHVRARDWRLHGHDADPAYGATVLHVVFHAESGRPARRIDGAVLPTVALAPFAGPDVSGLLAQWRAAGATPPNPQPCLSVEEAALLLDRAGMDRFDAKVARFEADLTCVDPRQALWAGTLETLGYARNAGPFRQLADRVPLLEAQASAHDSIQLVALLLGESGLLPCQRGRLALDGYTDAVQLAWRATGRRGPGHPLGWTWVGSRPGNGPVRRVAAAAALLADPAAQPLDAGVLAVLAELPGSRVAAALRTLLLRSGQQYWPEHGDLGRPLRRASALLGPDRAADAVVNALLPWAAAVARRDGNRVLEKATRAAYRAHPPLSHNQITRHMARQIIGVAGRSVVTTACRQQGLIHIYRGWCDARDCAACPAGGGRR